MRTITVAVLLFTLQGCYFNNQTVERVRRDLFVTSQPTGAAFHRTASGSDSTKGVTPASMSVEYEVVTTRFNRWNWVWTGLLGLAYGGVMSLALASGADPGRAIAETTVYLGLPFGALLWQCIEHEVAGDRVEIRPASVSLKANLDGYVPQVRTVSSSKETSRVLFEMQPEWYRHYGLFGHSQIGQAASLPNLTRACSDLDPKVRVKAVRAIGALQIPEADPVLLRMLEDKDASVRLVALVGLGPSHTQPVQAAMIRAAGDPDARVREATVRRMGGFPQANPAAIEILEVLVENESDPDTRKAARQALQKQKSLELSGRVTTATASRQNSAPVVIAVFDVQDPSRIFPAAFCDQLTDYLVTLLARSGRYRVIPRSRLKERLVTMKRDTHRPCYESSCQIELGKALAAGVTMDVKIIRLGDQCVLTANIYDLKTETSTQGTAAETPCTQEGLLEAAKSLLDQTRVPANL